MVDAKTRLVALAVLAGVGLSGCELNQKDPNYPAFALRRRRSPRCSACDGATAPVCRFRPTCLRSPASTDGTINIPTAPFGAPPFTLTGARSTRSTAGRRRRYIAHELQRRARRLDAQRLDRACRRDLPEQHEQGPGDRRRAACRASRARCAACSRYGTDYTAERVARHRQRRQDPQDHAAQAAARRARGATNIGYIVLLTNGITRHRVATRRSRARPTRRSRLRRPTAARITNATLDSALPVDQGPPGHRRRRSASTRPTWC